MVKKVVQEEQDQEQEVAAETEAAVKAPEPEPTAPLGMSAEDAAKLRAWIDGLKAQEPFHEVPPEALNHVFLELMERVAAVQQMRPCDVQKSTGLRHQHQRKLKPAPAGQQEVHVTLCTVATWANGMHLPLRPVVEWLLARLSSVLLMLGPWTAGMAA